MVGQRGLYEGQKCSGACRREEGRKETIEARLDRTLDRGACGCSALSSVVLCCRADFPCARAVTCFSQTPRLASLSSLVSVPPLVPPRPCSGCCALPVRLICRPFTCASSPSVVLPSRRWCVIVAPIAPTSGRGLPAATTQPHAQQSKTTDEPPRRVR
jgi:hypothetical protein